MINCTTIYHFSLDVKQKSEAQVDNVQDAKQNLQTNSSVLKHCQTSDHGGGRKQQKKRVRADKQIWLSRDLSREDAASRKELNGGVDVEESGRVDQWPCVSLDLGVVPLPLQKSVHLAQEAHTSSRQARSHHHPKFETLEPKQRGND